MHTIADKKLLMLRPDEIATDPNQPRKFFDLYDLESLAKSIAENGIIEPLTVRREDGGFLLIAGERRLRAAKIAGLRRVPCVLHKANDLTAAIYSLTENTQRANLNCFEEAHAIERVIKDSGLTQSEIAARLGTAQSTLCNKLRLLRLDEHLQNKIISASLTERHARALLRLEEPDREAALDKIISQGLSISQTDALVDEILMPPEPAPRKKRKRKSAIGDMKIFANSLSKLLSTLNCAGIDADSQKTETENYIEYTVRIKKGAPHPESAAG